MDTPTQPRQRTPRITCHRKARGTVALVCSGLFACATTKGVPPAPKPAQTLRVVSYNVHLGAALKDERKGKDSSIAKAFQQNGELKDVDILGLQELCSGENGWQLDYFDRVVQGGEGTVFRATAYADPTLTDRDPDIGPPCARVEAIVSRFPIVASGAVVLPKVREPRSAVWADIELPATAASGPTVLRVYNAHLENRTSNMSWEQGRAIQARALLAHVQAWQTAHPGAPVLLLGDFNTHGHLWNPNYRELTLQEIERSQLQPSLTQHLRTLTLLPMQTDWIFFRQLHLRDSHVVHLWLSDHFPVVADFDLSAAG